MNRVDKIMLLLTLATWHFDIVKNCLILIAFNTSAYTVSVNTSELLQMLKMSSNSLHFISQYLSKTRDTFILW